MGVVYLGTLAHAFSYGFSAVAIPDIRNEIRETNVTQLIPSIVATDEQLSWFGEDRQSIFKGIILTEIVSASCLNIGSIIGALVGGYLGGRVGPRRTLQLASVLGVVSWLLMALAPHLSGK